MKRKNQGHLKFRRTLSEFAVKSKSFILKRWGNIDEQKRVTFWKVVEKAVNYFANAFLLGLSIHLTFILFWESSLKKLGLLVMILWIMLPFIEHYYVWFREEWKKEGEEN